MHMRFNFILKLKIQRVNEWGCVPEYKKALEELQLGEMEP